MMTASWGKAGEKRRKREKWLLQGPRHQCGRSPRDGGDRSEQGCGGQEARAECSLV